MSRSQEKILQAAMVVLARNPLATLEQIADAAGLARTTLFRHFKTRQGLLRELTLEAYGRCTAVMTPILEESLPPLEKLRRTVAGLVPLGAAFHFLSYEPYRSADPEVEALIARYAERWRVLMVDLKQDRVLAPDVPEVWAADVLDMLVFGAWEGIHRGDLAPNTAADLVVRTFLRGVTP